MINSYDTLQALLWNELMDIIGADKSKTPAVRHSWPIHGAPDWKITDDVIFMQLAETEDDINIPLDGQWRDAERDLVYRQGVTRVFELRLNAYGPNCYDNLLHIRLALLNGRPNLRKQNVCIVPERTGIIKAPELFQSRWWNRADTRLKFNVLMVFDQDVKTIETVNITVLDNKVPTTITVQKSDKD